MTAPQVTYTILYKDQIVPLGSKIEASFASGFNTIIVRYVSSISLCKFEVRVTKADEDHGVGIGTCPHQEVGAISANEEHNFYFNITPEYFTKGDVDYRIGFYAKSATEDIWDATEILLSSDGDTLMNSNREILEGYTCGH